MQKHENGQEGKEGQDHKEGHKDKEEQEHKDERGQRITKGQRRIRGQRMTRGTGGISRKEGRCQCAPYNSLALQNLDIDSRPDGDSNYLPLQLTCPAKNT